MQTRAIYAIRIASQSVVQVTQYDTSDTVTGRPTGRFGYHGAIRQRIQELQQQASRSDLTSATVRELGEVLARVLFDATLRRDFLNFYEQAQQMGAYVRLELDIDERAFPEVAALPWEWMYFPADHDYGALWLGTDPHIALIRCRAQWKLPLLHPLAPGERLRIALAVAAPQRLGAVKYEPLWEALQRLAHTQPERFAPPILVPEATLQSIEATLEQEPHLFHLIGHARLKDAQQETGEIALADDLIPGEALWIDAQRFSDLFRRHRPGVVLLQACESGTLSSSQAFIGVASQVVQQQIPIVVAMQYAVSNATALRFAGTFYERLAKGDPVDKAVQEGRRSIALGPLGYTARDFATPITFMSAQHGQLFPFTSTNQPSDTLLKGKATMEKSKQTSSEPNEPSRQSTIHITTMNGGIVAGTIGSITNNTYNSSSQVSSPSSHHRPSQTNDRLRPTIGILTALPKEYKAMKALLTQTQKSFVEGARTDHHYQLGEVPAHGGSLHVVLAMLPSIGETLAAARTVHLLEHFPNVREIIMVGIAAGAPFPEKVDEHVRLGDIVVSNEYGVVQYDFVKRTPETTIYRPFPQRPSAYLLEAAKYLEADYLPGEELWLAFIEQALQRLHLERPDEATDVLHATEQPEIIVPHPADAKRRQGEPRVFFGPIASANTLLKDPVLRDALRDRFGVKAFEMEAAGVADATWTPKAGYLSIRGMCDYGDSYKNDEWQEYAAVVAAAYTRALLESLSASGDA